MSKKKWKDLFGNLEELTTGEISLFRPGGGWAVLQGTCWHYELPT